MRQVVNDNKLLKHGVEKVLQDDERKNQKEKGTA